MYGRLFVQFTEKEMGGKEMKTIRKNRNRLFLLSLLAGTAFLTGCVVYKTVPPALSVSEIIQMSKDGAWAKDIITQMKRTHSVYMMKAADIAELSKEGVQDSVLNYMDRTRIDAIRQRDYNNHGYWGPYGPGYVYGGFGWPYYSWGFGFGPAIVIHGGGHYISHSGRNIRK